MAGKERQLHVSSEEDGQLEQAVLEALDLLGTVLIKSSVGDA